MPLGNLLEIPAPPGVEPEEDEPEEDEPEEDEELEEVSPADVELEEETGSGDFEVVGTTTGVVLVVVGLGARVEVLERVVLDEEVEVR